jgi:type IV secretion system protein VirB1
MASARLPALRSAARLPADSTSTIAAAVAGFIWLPGLAAANPLDSATFGRLALRCGPTVAPSTLMSIAKTESAFQALTINDNTTGTSGVPANLDVALQIASQLLAAGHSVDLGIMQINSANFAKVGLTAASAFDPCQSIAAAAMILSDSYAGGETHAAQQAALRVALSRYNTGDGQRGFDNGYVHKVELAARHAVPALDVGRLPTAAINPAPRPPPSAPSADPNAPPDWDVWGSFDYAATHFRAHRSGDAPQAPTGLAVLADAGDGPTATVMTSGPLKKGSP